MSQRIGDDVADRNMYLVMISCLVRPSSLNKLAKKVLSEIPRVCATVSGMKSRYTTTERLGLRNWECRVVRAWSDDHYHTICI